MRLFQLRQPMTIKRLSRSVLVLAIAGCTFIGTQFLSAKDQAVAVAQATVAPLPDQLAQANELKTKAFEALKAGKFDLTNDYLSKAAELSKDPVTMKMADWTRQFEQQRQVFKVERNKEYEKTVKNVQLLQDKGKLTFAMEEAAGAYLLSDDKDAFRNEAWAVKLLAEAKNVAGE